MRLASFVSGLWATQAIPLVLGALTWKTYDISSLLAEEDKGVTYQTSDGTTQGLEVQAKNAGANSIKIRVYIDTLAVRLAFAHRDIVGSTPPTASMDLIMASSWAREQPLRAYPLC
jgi:hypothetical protein